MKYLSYILVLIAFTPAHSQPFSWFNQYLEVIGLFNPAAINPHFIQAGADYNWLVGATARNESGFNLSGQAPVSANFRLEYLQHKKGYDSHFGFFPSFGGYFFADDFGPTSFTTAHLKVGFYAPINTLQDGFLSGGLIGGFGRFAINWGDDFKLVETGDVLDGISYQQSFWNIGAGVFYQQKISRYQKVYMGLSTLGLTDIALTSPGVDGKFGQALSLHWHGIVGAYFSIDDKRFLEPALWVRSGKNFPLDTYLSVRYHHGFRTRDASAFWLKLGSGGFFDPNALRAGVELGIRLERTVGWPGFSIGLGYDFSLSELPSFYANAVEISTNFFLR